VINQNYSWVRARAECSLVAAYERLRLQVREDVEQRKALRTSTECERFNFNMISNGEAFTIGRVERNSRRSVTFRITGKSIQVIDDTDSLILEASLTLSDDGECRLKTPDKILCFWQCRRAALEELFF
jgi:hypothetical protein